MFSIYGVTGQTFRGTLEQMALAGAVRLSRHTRGINREGKGGSVEAITSGHLDAVAPRGHEQADAAYRRMLPRELDRGPLYHSRQVIHVPVITACDGDPAGANTGFGQPGRCRWCFL